LASVEKRLRDALATKVTVHASTLCRGSVSIEFYSRTDLDRLLDHIAPMPTL
jgi:hypothetical protein